MPVTVITGGRSEFVYLTAILDQGHAWARLAASGTKVVDANGDRKIPKELEKATAQGRRVVVVLDNDALARAAEQAAVIQRDDVPVYVLSSDFEGAFDPEIVRRALALLNYQADVDCLGRALQSAAVFDGIAGCGRATEGAKPLGKVQLAQALGDVSRRYWYLPREFDPVFEAVGKQCGVERTPPSELFMWSHDAEKIGADGRLYVCNHVSNESVRYWDFDSRSSVELQLHGRFDGLVAVCRRGSRFVARKFERPGTGGTPTNTWIHVFDLRAQTLEPVSRFRVSGSIYELIAEEDGNHLQLCIYAEPDIRYGLRCLVDGTQQEKIEIPGAAEMYGPKISRSGRSQASGPQPMRVVASQGDVTVFPHFYAHSYVWSPRERFLAFFARRWGKPPDFLWLYDLRSDQVHRLAAGDQFIPIYWT